ncbi:Alpha/Beta hydrolase fold containing protein [Parasponia andersonii]|uniref:Alpha/Beta hydrolase fold containing protein n=1 Tax=Parasponia andersonii TaxID=3476 RepID=A0A2P5AL17_PARAD|nr:Alpha/Beta hydrolase fold containing protein [Parasponia andersonii]
MANIENLKDLLQEENLYLITEAGEQGRLPVFILSTKEDNDRKRPAVVFLHRTTTCKEWLRPLLEAYASRGYITIAIDSRYHGERASNIYTYNDICIFSYVLFSCVIFWHMGWCDSWISNLTSDYFKESDSAS